jgi:UDP-N-acetylglucosamine acyltransferase
MPHMIHPTATVHPKAILPASVRVGPYAVIDEGVELGADCVVGPHVYLTGLTTVGARNRFHAGCVIGDAPQDLKYQDEPTRLRIGDDNVLREHVTVHRSNKAAEATVIGSGNFLMANAHVAHNCLIGSHVIIANGALLGGHVTVQDRAFISGNCLIHQFTRIGTLALMQGGAGIGKDLPPFTVAVRVNEICGLNLVGLRRAGYTAADRLELKKFYHTLFRGGQNFSKALADAQKMNPGPAAKTLLDFVAESRRGCCTDVSSDRSDAGTEAEG